MPQSRISKKCPRDKKRELQGVQNRRFRYRKKMNHCSNQPDPLQQPDSQPAASQSSSQPANTPASCQPVSQQSSNQTASQPAASRGAGGRGGGARGLNSERIRRSGQDPTCENSKHAGPGGGGGSNGLKPPAASPQQVFGWKSVSWWVFFF